jgi:bifunctional DNA-binding transcriptional regulator/antitoxin component of YhaV-PrlF toxin-antitoxin module
MTVTVKSNTPIMVPPAVSRRAGIKTGDKLEFRVSRGVITIAPKSNSEVDEYTAEQCRTIDEGIAKGIADVREGRVHGPFESVDEAIDHIAALARSRKKKIPRKSE